jgi:hypothetical protein
MELRELLTMILHEHGLNADIHEQNSLFCTLNDHHGHRMLFAHGQHAGQLWMSAIGKSPKGGDVYRGCLVVDLTHPDSIQQIVDHIKTWCQLDEA